MNRIAAPACLMLMAFCTNALAADAPYFDIVKLLPKDLAAHVEKEFPKYKIDGAIYRAHYDIGGSYRVQIYEFRFDDGTGKMRKGQLHVNKMFNTYPVTRVLVSKIPDRIKAELPNAFAGLENAKIVGDYWRWRATEDSRWVYDFSFDSKLGSGFGYLRESAPDEDFASMAFVVK